MAQSLGIEAKHTAARVRVSKFKSRGLIEAIADGVFKVTPAGSRFFGSNLEETE